MSAKAKLAALLFAAMEERQLMIYKGDRKGDHKRIKGVLAVEDQFRAAGGTDAEVKRIMNRAEASAMTKHFK